MLSQPHSFTEPELQANEDNKQKLIEFLRSGDAILMAGAGCSGSLFPAWGAFVTLLETEAKMVNPGFDEDSRDFLAFADKVKEAVGDGRYYSLIDQTFTAGNPTHQKFHEILCRIPFKGFTTTNYDRVLEYALNVISPNPNNSLHFEGTTRTKINEFLLSLNYNKNLPKRIVHLHGIHDQYDSIILSGKEYKSKYGFSHVINPDSLYDQIRAGEFSQVEFQKLMVQYGYEWPIRRKLLWSLMATRRLFFIGFSMSDPYFMKMLNFIQDDLSTYRSETHFLLLRVSPDNAQSNKDFAARLKREYGIVTVFFEEPDGQYEGLGNFIIELEDMVNVKREARIVVENVAMAFEEPAAAVDNGDPAITDTLFTLSGQQEQDED